MLLPHQRMHILRRRLRELPPHWRLALTGGRDTTFQRVRELVEDLEHLETIGALDAAEDLLRAEAER